MQAVIAAKDDRRRAVGWSAVDARRSQARVAWLDGVRGAAAMFVVLHHMWLTVWQSYPNSAGPWWVAWLLYGHLAVAIFIVVSGFSLALAPLRDDARLRGGTRRFVRRRAWRILPAYWAALVLSTLVTAYLLRPDLAGAESAKAFVVHGLLLQDVIGSETPNGAFWSIAVEWQIYFVFPLILLAARKTSVEAAVAITVGIVLIAHALIQLGSPFSKIDHVSPQFLALFAVGVLAVKLGRGDNAARLRRPLGALALIGFLVVVLLAIVQGSVWMVDQFFYVDLAFGLAFACLLVVMFSGGLAPASRLLTSRVGRGLGLFSYSIYLIHGPIVALLGKYVIGPTELPVLAQFFMFLVIGLPVVLVLCYGFHRLFEAPFLRYRDMQALRSLPLVHALRRLGRSRTPRPEAAGEYT
jgi:peptidoglycan/LPS O-acetylase OafA/YrhL